MVNILTEKDLADIAVTENDMPHPEGIQLLETIIRMECNFEDEPEVNTYHSLYNAFTFLYRQFRTIYPKVGEKCRDLILPRRMEHKGTKSARHKVLLDEIKIRTNQITWVYSEIVRNNTYDDPNLIKAAAHWLKFCSDDFYKESEAQHANIGIDFIWGGLEKSVGFIGIDQNSEQAYYVLVMSDDLMVEENLAQYAGGILSQPLINKKAAQIREQFNMLHETPYFCILDPVEKKKSA